MVHFVPKKTLTFVKYGWEVDKVEKGGKCWEYDASKTHWITRILDRMRREGFGNRWDETDENTKREKTDLTRDRSRYEVQD